MKVDGACHCGDLTFEAQIDPDGVRICHCTDCQTLTGSAFRVTVQALATHFQLLTGKPTMYLKIADSGKQRVQAFCPRCGTPIYSALARDPEAYAIRVGALRQRAALAPKRQIWYRSALKWVTELSKLPHADRQ